MHVHVTLCNIHAVKVSAREGVRKNEDRKTPLDLTQDTIAIDRVYISVGHIIML